MTKTTLSEYQQKILNRLKKGEHLTRSLMGPWTGAFRFNRDKAGLNYNSIQKLRTAKLVTTTDKMTMHGVCEYCHLPGQEPWTKDPSWQQYQSYHEMGQKVKRR